MIKEMKQFEDKKITLYRFKNFGACKQKYSSIKHKNKGAFINISIYYPQFPFVTYEIN